MISMRYGLLVVIIVAFLTASCAPCIPGSGIMVKEDRVLTGFTGIALEGSEHMIVKQGDYAVALEGDDNILQYYQTLIVNDQLVVRQKDNVCITPTRPIIVYVTLPEISSLTLSGSGNILTDSFKAKDLRISLSGSGEIDTEVDAESLATVLSGSGTINLAGKAQKHDLTISGSGDVHALDLKVQQSAITISGSGNADVAAVEKLDMVISGSGNVFYTGSPDVTSQITGSGQISQPE